MDPERPWRTCAGMRRPTMNRWVVYSTCSIFALCSPAGFAPGPQVEESSVPPAAVELGPGPLGAAPEPAPHPTGAQALLLRRPTRPARPLRLWVAPLAVALLGLLGPLPHMCP